MCFLSFSGFPYLGMEKHFLLIIIHCNFCYLNFNLLLSKEALGECGQIGFAPPLGLHYGHAHGMRTPAFSPSSLPIS